MTFVPIQFIITISFTYYHHGPYRMNSLGSQVLISPFYMGHGLKQVMGQTLKKLKILLINNFINFIFHKIKFSFKYL